MRQTMVGLIKAPSEYLTRRLKTCAFSSLRLTTVLATSLGLLLFFVLLRSQQAQSSYVQHIFDDTIGTTGNRISLPHPYSSLPYGSDGHEDQCSDRYGTGYIRRFSDSATEYCKNETGSSLTCFTHKSHDSRTDSFCVGQPAVIDASARTVGLHCPLRDWTDEDHARGAAPLSSFELYWYATGPRTIFEQFMNFDDHNQALLEKPETTRTVLLVKREDTVENLWHTLMQVMSVWLSLDVLRTARDPTSGKAFSTHLDVSQIQTVILDSFEDGPFWEMWSMFGGLPVVRLPDFDPASSPTQQAVIPLPGGSNPMWQGDWIDLDCDNSALLEAFSLRILEFFEVFHKTSRWPHWNDRKTLTFIDRKKSRSLDNQDALVQAIRSRFPQVDVHLVDFAALSFKQQLETVASTDILVGVHGAGLTHGMFLKPNSTIVEIRPPVMDHKGFKNMAKFLGHRYFSEHSVDRDHPGKTGDWHNDRVFIEEESLLKVIDEAIASATK
ncbi:DUF563 domain-containing protein [Zymoseptoria brevis]|uniref:EGF domain-specific O-linked N-acetylglucosamine transferase n=1 Tax=Zymoseptoria brevis TaxID=1047168 RepID=A0A0F4GCT5_9PEZI|nr:DUF563 domain-containing protein [Zymoseptoria brevis]